MGGIENYLINLFENTKKADIKIELLSLGEWALTERLVVLGHKVKIFSKDRINFGSVKEIGKYCTENNIDLLVSQGTVANAYAKLVAKFYHIPNLVTVHSDPSADYQNVVIRNIYRLVDLIGRKQTRRYIAVSEYLKSVLIKSGVSARMIDVVYNGADYPAPKPRAHKRLVIGSIGRLHHVKGYDLLIRAFAQLENKRLRLKIAGEGDELSSLRKLANDLGIRSRVEFVGYKSDIYKFLDLVDIYVQPSRCEGFGLALVQAMSQSLPVVVTPVGSMTEIVADKKTGYISTDLTPQSIANAITKAVEDIDSSTVVGKNAREYVINNFLTKQWVDKTVEAYQKVIK